MKIREPSGEASSIRARAGVVRANDASRGRVHTAETRNAGVEPRSAAPARKPGDGASVPSISGARVSAERLEERAKVRALGLASEEEAGSPGAESRSERDEHLGGALGLSQEMLPADSGAAAAFAASEDGVRLPETFASASGRSALMGAQRLESHERLSFDDGALARRGAEVILENGFRLRLWSQGGEYHAALADSGPSTGPALRQLADRLRGVGVTLSGVGAGADGGAAASWARRMGGK